MGTDFGHELPKARQVRGEKDRLVSIAVFLEEGIANGSLPERVAPV